MTDTQHNEYIEIPTTAASEEDMPTYSSSGAAGADVRACIKEPLTLHPGERTLIPSGLKMSIPEGYEIQIRPRSGLALKHGITLLNTPGTIDSDYRGEIGIIIINHGKEPFLITPGMRIAQFVVARVIQAHFIPCDSLVATTRGAGGFGHTGTQ
jgi:dUTP pyrophosphatase